jgi:hypothetical protein
MEEQQFDPSRKFNGLDAFWIILIAIIIYLFVFGMPGSFPTPEEMFPDDRATTTERR